jgi:hypothetical protein
MLVYWAWWYLSFLVSVSESSFPVELWKRKSEVFSHYYYLLYGKINIIKKHHPNKKKIFQ